MIVACIELNPGLGDRKSMLEILQFVERGRLLDGGVAAIVW